MAIYKQKASALWWIAIYRQGRPRIRVSSGTRNRSEAEVIERTLKLAHAGTTPRQRLHAALDALMGADNDSAPALPLTGIWDAYTVAARAAGLPALSNTTARLREGACKRLARWTAEHWPRAKSMQSVDRACAFAFADYLLKEGAGDKTRANVLGDLGTVWRVLMVRTGIAENVWALTKPKSVAGKHGRAFTRDEEAAILKAAQSAGYDWHPVCLVARYTGLRYGDIARLKWAAVDLAASRICLRPSKTAKHGIELGIPIHPVLAAKLANRPRDPSGFVFPEHAADYARHNAGDHPFKDVLTAAGIRMDKDSMTTFHSWRHTFRTRLSEAGAPQEIAMALGGWTQASTAGLYSHDWGALDKAVRAMS